MKGGLHIIRGTNTLRGVNSHLVTASPRSRRQAAMGAIPHSGSGRQTGSGARRAADGQGRRIGDPRATGGTKARWDSTTGEWVGSGEEVGSRRGRGWGGEGETTFPACAPQVSPCAQVGGCPEVTKLRISRGAPQFSRRWRSWGRHQDTGYPFASKLLTTCWTLWKMSALFCL